MSTVLDLIARELRYALRRLRWSPGFAILAVAMLAVTIGANTAIFSAVNRLLVAPLPYRDADRLVVIGAERTYEGAAHPVRISFTTDAVERWRPALHAFDALTFSARDVLQLSTRGGSEIVDAAHVGPSFFGVLGGPIAAGRPLGPADALRPTVVISHRLAERLFGSPGEAPGAALRLNTQTYTVVGVAGAGWDVPAATVDVWDSSGFAHMVDGRCCSVDLIGRLRAGVSPAAAGDDVRDTARALASVDADSFAGLHTTVTSLRNSQLGRARHALLLLWAAVSVVSIIACANLVNLFLARHLGRIREIAVRRALGATSGRLVLQGLAEAGILCAAGIAGGLVLARAALGALGRVDVGLLPRLDHLQIDAVVCGYAVALGTATMLFAGILPAARLGTAPLPRTPAGAPTGSHRRLQRLLCAAQLAAALVLLIGATLLGRSLSALLQTDLGVLPDHVITASISAAFGREHSARELAATMARVIERIRSVPGVRAVGVGTSLPPDTSNLRMTLRRKGDQVDYVASAVSCTPGYFQALGMRLQKGRFFAPSDDAQHAPVIIVSARTARRLFGDADPIGQTMGVPKFPYQLASGDEATVVGVVADVKYSGVDAAPDDQVYWSLAQAPWLSAFLVARTSGDVDLTGTLRPVVASVDPTVAVTAVTPLPTILSTATAPARVRAGLVAAFAGLGLLIAATGLYGIVAYSVSRRTAELGVRVALGASGRDIVGLVLGESLSLAAWGIAVGAAAAWAASRLLGAMLFGIAPDDPPTYIASAAVLLLTTLAASYAPARRAARLDPATTLRAE